MIKLNAGISRKVGERNYGSRGASVNLELELESHLIGDPDGLSHRIRKLFDLARQAVDDELNGRSQGRASGYGHPADRSQPNRSTTGGNGNRDTRPATVSQLRAIRSICTRRRLDADAFANQRFAVNTIDELTLQEASRIIDELKSAPANNRNGGDR